MTSVVCVLSLLGATIFPQDASVAALRLPDAIDAEPLTAVSSYLSAEGALPFVGPLLPDERFIDLDFEIEQLPVIENPGLPPDSEPIPYKPTPNQPDGPAIPQPRNYETYTLRGRTLNKLAELGAVQWQLDVFDCIGWYESKWQNVRSATGDSGVLQINDVHWPQLNAQGLDPWVPEHAAIFGWQLSRQGTRFSPWSVRRLCGV